MGFAGRPGSRPCSLARAVAAGLGASAAILAANQAADRLALTDLDLPRVLGLSFRDPGQVGLKPAGAAWYFLAGGLLVPTAYWLGFRALGGAGLRRGLAFGLLHYAISGLILALTEPRHPKRRHGRGRPMGPLLAHYGAFERVANALGHLAFGAAIGALSGRR